MQEISWSPSHRQFHWRFTTKGYLCVSDRCCLAHQLGRSDLCQRCLVQFFGGCINKCQEKLLEQSNTHLSSVWPRSMRSCRKSLHIEHSVECLHVMRSVEGHIRTNRLRVHLEGVHPHMKLSNTFRWRGSLTWTCCVAPSKTIRNPKVFPLMFVDPWSKKMKSPISSARSPLTRQHLGFTKLQNGHVFTTS